MRVAWLPLGFMEWRQETRLTLLSAVPVHLPVHKHCYSVQQPALVPLCLTAQYTVTQLRAHSAVCHAATNCLHFKGRITPSCDSTRWTEKEAGSGQRETARPEYGTCPVRRSKNGGHACPLHETSAQGPSYSLLLWTERVSFSDYS
jgi:hypothetical protein